MVLPVLGLLGLGAAGLFGSAGKAIAGGAGEQYADLYQDTMKEKLDYMKRKRLMEESDKLSRQGKLMDDKEAEKKERAKAEKKATQYLTRLTQEGRYTPKNAVAIMAGGEGAISEALSFSKGLKADALGVRADPNTFYTTFIKDSEISELPSERQTDIKKDFTTRTRSQWIERATNILDPNADFTTEYTVQRTKGQPKVSEDFIDSNAKIMARMTQVESELLNSKKTGNLFKQIFPNNEALHNIELSFDSENNPNDANTIEAFRLINNIRNTAIKNQGTKKSNVAIKDKNMNSGQRGTINAFVSQAINDNPGSGFLKEGMDLSGRIVMQPSFSNTRNAQEHLSVFFASEQALKNIRKHLKLGTDEAPEFTQYFDFIAEITLLQERSASKRGQYLTELKKNHDILGQPLHDTNLEKYYVPQKDFLEGFSDYSNRNFQGLDYLELNREQKMKYLNSKRYDTGTVIYDTSGVPMIMQAKDRYYFIGRQ